MTRTPEKTLTFSFKTREESPYVNRIRLMWESMRPSVIAHFPASSEKPEQARDYLKSVAKNYISDAYHSLSIEGYHVTEDLIERVRSGKWSPETNSNDADARNALAARGYWQAHQAVQNSIKRVLNGENSALVAKNDHRSWYRELFSPSVATGLIEASDLAGYRNAPVHIRQSMHVPPNCDAIRDLMPALFELLEQEEEASIRIVLGHFVFVYIHPYMDGNGRMGRFLMNLMLASGGYPWLVIPVEQRHTYMAALEEASVNQNIVPFTEFLAGLLNIKH